MLRTKCLFAGVATLAATCAVPSSANAANLISNGEFELTASAAVSGPYFLRPQDKVGFNATNPVSYADPIQWTVGGGGLTNGTVMTLNGWGAQTNAGQGALIQNNNGGWEDDAGGDDLNTVALIRLNDSAYFFTTISASSLIANTTYELSFDFAVNTDTFDWETQLRSAVLAAVVESGGSTTTLDLSSTPETADISNLQSTLDTTFSVQYTTGATPVDLEIRLGSADAGVGGNALAFGFDNVVFDVVPEPSSLALMGLGGLALMNRRRK